jgi:hypothetical protein
MAGVKAHRGCLALIERARRRGRMSDRRLTDRIAGFLRVVGKGSESPR